MTDQERLRALEKACPGATADFLFPHLASQTAIDVAQAEWGVVVKAMIADNAELRARVADFEARYPTVQMVDDEESEASEFDDEDEAAEIDDIESQLVDGN